MAIVGTAYVRVEAISGDLSKQIREDLRRAAAEAKAATEREFNRLGEESADAYGRGFSGKVGREMSKGLKDVDPPSADLFRAGERASNDVARGFNSTIKEKLRDGFRGINFPGKDMEAAGNRHGNIFTKAFGSAISKGLKGLKIGAILSAVFAAPGAIGGVAAAATALVTALAQGIAALGPAIAGAGVAAAAGFAPLLITMKLVKLGLKADADAAKVLKEQTDILKQVIGKPVATEMFPGLQKSVAMLTKAFAQGPIQDGLADIGAAVGGVAENMAKAFGSTKNVAAIGRILQNTGGFMEDIGKGAGGLVTAFISILDALRPITNQIGEMVGQFGEWAGSTLSAKAASGELSATFQRMFDSFLKLSGALVDFGKGVRNVFSAASGGSGTFLDTLQRVAEKFKEWTDSASGQTALGKFFTNMKAIASALLPVFGKLFGAVGSAVGAFDPAVIQHFADVASHLVDILADMFAQMAGGGVGDALLNLIDALLDGFGKLVDSGIIGEVSEKLSDVINAIATGLTSDSFAQTMNDVAAAFENIWGPLSQLWSSQAISGGGLKTAFSDIGSSLSGFLSYLASGDFASSMQSFTESLSTVIDKVKDFGATDAGKTILKIGAAFGVAAVTIGPLFKAFGNVSKVLGPVVSTFGNLFSVIRPLLGPIGLIVGAFILMFKNSEKLRDALGDLVTAGFGALMDIWDRVQPAFERLVPVIEKLFGFFGDLAASLIDQLVPVIEDVAPLIGDLVASFLDLVAAIAEFLMPVIEALWPVVQKAFQIILDAVEPVIRIFQGIIDFFTGVFTGNWTQVWEGVKEVFSGAWDLIIGLFTGLWDMISGVIGTLFTNLMEFGGKIVSSIWDGISGAWDSIATWFTGLWDNITTWLGDLYGNLMIAGATIITNIVTGITDGAQALWDWFINLPTKIGEFFVDLFTSVFGFGGDIVTNIVGGITDLAQDLWDWFISLPGVIGGYFVDVIAKGLEAGGDLIGQMVEGVSGAIGDLWQWFTDLAGSIVSSIVDFISGWLGVGTEIVLQIIEGLTGAITQVWAWFTGLVGSIIDGVWDFISGFLEVGGEIIKKIVEGLGAGIQAIWDFIVSIPEKVAGAVAELMEWAAGVGKALWDKIVEAFTGSKDFGALGSALPDIGARPFEIPIHLSYLLGKSPSIPSFSALAQISAGPVAPFSAGAFATGALAAGQSSLVDTFTRALTNTARASAVGTSEGSSEINTNVRVYIGNSEITRFIRTEVDQGEQRLASQIYNGRRVLLT
jgi:phage-related protein